MATIILMAPMACMARPYGSNCSNGPYVSNRSRGPYAPSGLYGSNAFYDVLWPEWL